MDANQLLIEELKNEIPEISDIETNELIDSIKELIDLSYLQKPTG